MGLAIRYVVGRVVRHMLRAPTVDGWLAEESDMQPQRISCALKKLPGGRIGIAGGPGADVLAISTEGAAALAGDDLTVLIGWPEEILVVRRGRAVAYAEGDIVHFGDLALDGQRVLRRIGYDYINESTAEVRAHVQLEERSNIDASRAFKRLGFETDADHVPGAQGVLHRTGVADQTVMANAKPPQVGDAPILSAVRLGPGQRARFGPYELVNERSFDHERRPQAGETGHGYFFRLRRIGEELVGGRDPGLPEPLAVKTPEELISAARAQGLLDDDEVLAGETALLAERLALYEGARGALEQELAAVGPSPPRLRWRGDTLEAHAGSISRSEHGAPVVGRTVISLSPAGTPTVSRTSIRTLPGRLRRQATRPV